MAQATWGDRLPSQSCSQCSREHVTVMSAGAMPGSTTGASPPSRSVQPPCGRTGEREGHDRLAHGVADRAQLLG